MLDIIVQTCKYKINTKSSKCLYHLGNLKLILIFSLSSNPLDNMVTDVLKTIFWIYLLL